MRAIRKTIFMTFLLALVTAGMATSGMAQLGSNDAAVRDIVRRIQTRTDSLQRAVQNAADRNNYRVDDINRLIVNFENAANQLDRRLGTRRSTTADAQTLLDYGAQIDNFFAGNRLGAGSRREWQAIRADLDQLAGYYNLSPRWSSSDTGYNNGGYSNNNYTLSDVQMRQLADRLNMRTATFSRNLRLELLNQFFHAYPVIILRLGNHLLLFMENIRIPVLTSGVITPPVIGNPWRRLGLASQAPF